MTRLTTELFRRQTWVIVVFVMVLIYGVYSYVIIPKRDMPALDTPYMVVEIDAPGLNALEMETDIVIDTEKTIDTFEGVSEIRTTIYPSKAIIITIFEYSVDDPTTLSEDIFLKILDLSLPEEITSMNYTSDYKEPHAIYALHDETLSKNELEQTGTSLRNQLLLVDEINQVQLHSPTDEQVIITINQSLLPTYNLSITTIYQKLLLETNQIPLGRLHTAQGSIGIRRSLTDIELDTLRSIQLIPASDNGGTALLLGDIATITQMDVSQKEYQYNNEDAVLLSVYFDSGIDFTRLGKTLTDEVQSFEQDHTTIQVDSILFLPDIVDDQINNVFYSLLAAIAIVFVIVMLGIGFKNGLLIILTIPIIIFGTVGLLHVFGYELHKLTIVGLIVAIGIVVDNSIVITESIKRNMEHDLPPIDAANQAILKNAMPLLSSTTTTIAAFIVIVLLPGFLGRVVSSMPLTVIIALSLSFLISMMVSPILAVLFIKVKRKRTIDITPNYKILRFFFRYPYIWLVVAFLFLGGMGFLVFTQQPLQLYPNDARQSFYIDLIDENTALPSNVRSIGEELSNTLRENPNVISVTSSYGGDFPPIHFSTTRLEERPTNARLYVEVDYDESRLLSYKDDVRTILEDYDITSSVQLFELRPPGPPIRLYFQSDSIQSLEDLDSIINDLEDLDSVMMLDETSSISSPTLLLEYNQTTLDQYGITKGEVDEAFHALINGYDLKITDSSNGVVSVTLESNVSEITDILQASYTHEPTNTTLPFASLITLSLSEDYTIIERYNNLDVRMIDLYKPTSIDTRELLQDTEGVLSQYNLDDYKLDITGEFSMFEEIQSSLIRASIIAVVLIYIILVFQFNSIVKPLIILLTIPLSFSGSLLFLWLFNSPITATSLIGMVSLLGVTVNTGILLMEYMSRYEEVHTPFEAAMKAVEARFRPIILTSATTIFGLIPLLITGGNFFQPMALTFMGGLLTSTFMTIIVLPSTYLLLYNDKKKTTS